MAGLEKVAGAERLGIERNGSGATGEAANGTPQRFFK
jgi:hypothetical protein